MTFYVANPTQAGCHRPDSSPDIMEKVNKALQTMIASNFALSEADIAGCRRPDSSPGPEFGQQRCLRICNKGNNLSLTWLPFDGKIMLAGQGYRGMDSALARALSI